MAVPGENRLVDYQQLSDISLPRYSLHLFREKDFIEILLTECRKDIVYFRKNNSITMPIDEFGLTNCAEVPFVNPAWQLLFKSLNPREKDIEDFQHYLPIMSDRQKDWLAKGIRRMKPN